MLGRLQASLDRVDLLHLRLLNVDCWGNICAHLAILFPRLVSGESIRVTKGSPSLVDVESLRQILYQVVLMGQDG